jgi:hypothetical protein
MGIEASRERRSSGRSRNTQSPLVRLPSGRILFGRIYLPVTSAELWNRPLIRLCVSM